ncbi:hypothetical protein L2E82_16244 [Cichorium intybus]|uniref:Uncharacterized protein n=1 Tax=Cichorium intybus TaxID=13427 RepID=A0ACB9F501_CICIN|nr:hypothetical protein L2E82_16244 [Cichorium intybus]
MEESRYQPHEIEQTLEGFVVLPDHMPPTEMHDIDVNVRVFEHEEDTDGDDELINDTQVYLAKEIVKRNISKRILMNKLNKVVHDNDINGPFMDKAIALEYECL